LLGASNYGTAKNLKKKLKADSFAWCLKLWNCQKSKKKKLKADSFAWCLKLWNCQKSKKNLKQILLLGASNYGTAKNLKN